MLVDWHDDCCLVHLLLFPDEHLRMEFVGCHIPYLVVHRTNRHYFQSSGGGCSCNIIPSNLYSCTPYLLRCLFHKKFVCSRTYNTSLEVIAWWEEIDRDLLIVCCARERYDAPIVIHQRTDKLVVLPQE